MTPSGVRGVAPYSRVAQQRPSPGQARRRQGGSEERKGPRQAPTTTQRRWTSAAQPTGLATPCAADSWCRGTEPSSLEINVSEKPARSGAPSRHARRLPGLPAVLRQRLIPSPRPSRGRERVALCRHGASQEPRQAPLTASVERQASASRPSPSGGLAASLDPGLTESPTPSPAAEEREQPLRD